MGKRVLELDANSCLVSTCLYFVIHHLILFFRCSSCHIFIVNPVVVRLLSRRLKQVLC
jgi:hypothetical protein